jgi:hypothetical protein
LKAWILIVSIYIPLLFYACHKADTPADPSPPVASLSVTPASGEEPLPVHVLLSGTDVNGDISKYKLYVDDTITVSKSTPFDTTIVFGAGTHFVYGEVVDARGAIGKSPIGRITANALPVPIGSLSASVLTGDSPLQTRLKLTSAPGSIPLWKYELNIDDKVFSRSTPIDTLITLYAGLHKVSGKVYGANNTSASTPIIDIDVKIVSGDGAKWIAGGSGILYPLPKGPVNLFEYPGDAEYNSLTTKEERDNYIENARITDITSNIPTGIDFLINGKVYSFVCAHVSELFQYNNHDWKDLYDATQIDTRKYGWYNGENFDSIYVHGGTIKFRDSHKAPIYTAQVAPTHAMNFAVTGDDLRDGNAINFVEMMYGVSGSNVKPGEKGIPLNYNGLMLGFSYTYIKDGLTWLQSVSAVEYNIVNGVIQFVATNPNFEVIMRREDIPK